MNYSSSAVAAAGEIKPDLVNIREKYNHLIAPNRSDVSNLKSKNASKALRISSEQQSVAIV